ncbi:DEAD/DEAH box helicase family protein [Neobacillus muris]|uniref:DEAD/DEAH box helicase family protein n=1 Tax=Neobacillus muris TaxID=2941334 RepID=UPI00203EAE15|nr:DEAD/DEAH box helicase family protein [Neobacillus muris]
MAKKNRLSEKEGRDVKDYDAVNDIVDEQFNKGFSTSGVNFKELLAALQSEKMPIISDYKEWIRYLMAFNDMEREGLITNEQKNHLAEAIDDGNRTYEKEFEKLKGYDEVTIGSLIYRLQQNGISTNHIFNFSERYELRVDVSMDMQGKITENPEVFHRFQEILLAKENSGKRILLISDTGTGKSTAILEVLKNMTNFQTQYQSPQGFSILSIPRLNLINNLKGRFELIPKSNTVTGSTKYISGEREKVIQNSTNILTTLDHSPVVLQMKREKQNLIEFPQVQHEVTSTIPMLMVLDECHMLSTDSTFKPEAIREYSIAEKALLDDCGISLHITATPENLRSEDYDLIIKINQLDRENPFEQAGYLMLNGSSKQVKDKLLQIIKIAARKNPERRILLFIEKKETIADFIKELKNENILAMGVVSKKEEVKSGEEKSIVCEGIIPEKIQVILATTALSAGVSIENNRQVDETWVLCSAESLNHEMTRIVQMSHRFRKQYHALKLFFQKPKNQEKKKVFLYHTFLDEEIKKAEAFKVAIEIMREKQLEGRITLDDLEMQNGLFADEEGKLQVCTPLIQSEIVQHKLYYNYNNPDVLLNELEKKFQCRFLEMNVNEAIEMVDGNETRKTKQPVASKEPLKCIIDDESVYNQLKNDFYIIGKSQFRSTMKKKMKLSTVKDLEYLFDSSCDFFFARKILEAHIAMKKDETVSYMKDRGALDWLKKILQSKENSLSVRLHRELSKYLELTAITKQPLQFNTKKDLKTYLKAVASNLLEDSGFSFQYEKVGSFEDLLKIKKGKSGNVRTYTVVGFIDENYVKEKYGIDKII